MRRGRSARPPALAPPVTITDPALPARHETVLVGGAPGPEKGSPGRRRFLAGRGRLLLAVLLLLAVGLQAGRSVWLEHRREAVATEAAGLRLVLVEARATPVAVGVPGDPVQRAPVDLLLRNDSAFPVTVLGAGLDGTAPALPARRTDPGGQVVVPVRWRVLCAEVGELPGPRLLTLSVRATTGVARKVALRLPTYDDPVGGGAGTARTFHAAAVLVCGVLVPKEQK